MDNDVSGVGQSAADACTERYRLAGRKVRQLKPREKGTDFNDVLVKKVSQP